MPPFVVKEQKRYSREELKEILQCENNELSCLINLLKQYNVLKAVKASHEQLNMNELIDIDIEISEIDSLKYYYVFTYVGVIIIQKKVIKCFPKYLSDDKLETSHLKQVVEVLKKYKSKEQFIKDLLNDTHDNFNSLELVIYLLHEYYEYGIYSNSEDKIEINGMGEINWGKTINDSTAYLFNNQPYYFDVFTKSRIDDKANIIRLIHECVLTECSAILEENGLLDLFNLTPVRLSELQLNSLGSTDEILYYLEKERNIQFNTRKQNLLQILYAYVNKSGLDTRDIALKIYGTNSFNLVWETACSEVFDNLMNRKISEIEKSLFNYSIEEGTLKEIIEKPVWSVKDDGELKEILAPKTLEPDIVTVYNDNDSIKLAILDAKYYVINFKEAKKISGQPGVSDITKQYMYQKSLNSRMVDNNSKNCFILPTDKDDVVEIGSVRIGMFDEDKLSEIQVRLLPVDLVFNKYLNNGRLDVDVLRI